MFAFDLLGVDFADGMSGGGEMAVLDPSGIGVKMLQPKWLQQLVQLDKHFIRSTPERIRQDHSGEVIYGVPQPALVSLVLHETLHLIDLRRFNSANFHGNGVQPTPRDHRVVHLREPARFFFSALITVPGPTRSTRAISRIRLPLSVISTICCFTSGWHPG